MLNNFSIVVIAMADLIMKQEKYRKYVRMYIEIYMRQRSAMEAND